MYKRQPNIWHRLVFTWSGKKLELYVDGAAVSKYYYGGALDDTVFVYRLFPESGNTGKQMTLAKALIANEAWSAAQVKDDYRAVVLLPPSGGAYVTNQLLGVIHRDVLGYADANADLSTAPLVNALTTGLSTLGATAVRIANGSSGASADQEDWKGGPSCTATIGSTIPAPNLSTHDTLDNYVQEVSLPLGTSIGFTVNYGSNPPSCNAGGDPVANGADLVELSLIHI